VVRREPRAFEQAQTRWTLGAVQTVCDWLRLRTAGGLSRLLARLQLSWQRARDYVHSPDPDYDAKRGFIADLVAQGQAGTTVTLFLDELTYYRQPSLARAWEAQGAAQPRALRSHRSNTATRLLGTLDVRDGRVVYYQGPRVGPQELVRFYQQLRAAYPTAARLYVVQDNWPWHFHPDVQVALEAQEQGWPWYRPPRWATEPSAAAQRRWGALQLPVQLVPLPTYASWLNPIEKLWRKLKQERLHLHRLADHLDELRTQVTTYLDQFAGGSSELLRYVGLSPPDYIVKVHQAGPERSSLVRSSGRRLDSIDATAG
jgi:DDE superfamily endonuclease